MFNIILNGTTQSSPILSIKCLQMKRFVDIRKTHKFYKYVYILYNNYREQFNQVHYGGLI